MFLDQLTSTAQSCLRFLTSETSLVSGLFIMGLIGGVTHCAGMCGPFILSQCGRMQKVSDAALIPYHVGRIITYTILALIMYSLVNVLSFFTPLRLFLIVPLLTFAGVLFIVNAFPSLFQIFPWMRHFTLPVPQKLIARLSKKTSSRLILGMILGVMPCGMVMAAIMAAATAPTAIIAITAMAAFGLGTMPALIAVAMGGQKLSQKYPSQMVRVRQGVMIWSGLWLFAMAGFLVFERIS